MLLTSLVVASSDFTFVVIQVSATGVLDDVEAWLDSGALLLDGTTVGFCVLEGCGWFSGVFGRAGEFALDCAKEAAANKVLAMIKVNRCEWFMMGTPYARNARCLCIKRTNVACALDARQA
jgi:hypothetical protein